MKTDDYRTFELFGDRVETGEDLAQTIDVVNIFRAVDCHDNVFLFR